MRRGPMLVFLTVLAATRPLPAAVQNDPLFARLGVHVAGPAGLAPQVKTEVLATLAGRSPDSDDEALLLEALIRLSPAFAAALDAYDEEEYAASSAGFDALADADDPFVKYNARAFAAKARVHAGRLVEAEERITALLGDVQTLAMFSLDEAELVYMLGYCQVQNLEHAAAQATLRDFLRDYPDASPRFVVTARQMLAELDRRIPESIGEVADLMSFSELRLAARDAGERTRAAQDRAVELLDKLIEDVENQEQQAQSSSNPAQRNRQQNRPDQPQPPNTPMDQSQAAPGSPASGPKRDGRVVNPGDAWGAMPPAERERILQVLRDRFPGRYRALVEQYYESLAEQP